MRYYLYPVHASRSFVTLPTLASSLYLLLLRFLSRQYELVFRMADSCVSDTALTPEERQVRLQAWWQAWRFKSGVQDGGLMSLRHGPHT